jgi:hypothetical protein
LYSASSETSLHLVERIVFSIRAQVPNDFVLGIKINSADYVDRGSDLPADADGEKRATEHIRTIASWRCVDFIEVSGGNYENPGEFFFELFGAELIRAADRVHGYPSIIFSLIPSGSFCAILSSGVEMSRRPATAHSFNSLDGRPAHTGTPVFCSEIASRPSPWSWKGFGPLSRSATDSQKQAARR